MPRDPRLYMTFPNDIHRHPKIQRLDPAVRWAFLEMNGEARIADNDGVFAEEDADFTWGRDVMDALVDSHPSRPLVLRENATYVIRDYAEHQETKASRQERSAQKSEAGRKGAAARWGGGDRLAPAIDTHGTRQAHGGQAVAESESESEDSSKTSMRQSSTERARVSTDAVEPSEMTKRLAAQRGVTSLAAVVDAVRQHAHREVSADAALRISLHLLDKAKSPRAPQRYVTGSIARSPFEVQKFIDDNALGMTA